MTPQPIEMIMVIIIIIVIILPGAKLLCKNQQASTTIFS